MLRRSKEERARGADNKETACHGNPSSKNGRISCTKKDMYGKAVLQNVTGEAKSHHDVLIGLSMHTALIEQADYASLSDILATYLVTKNKGRRQVVILKRSMCCSRHCENACHAPNQILLRKNTSVRTRMFQEQSRELYLLMAIER